MGSFAIMRYSNFFMCYYLHLKYIYLSKRNLLLLWFWRFNLIQLFLQNEQSSHLRKMIVDLEVNALLMYEIWFAAPQPQPSLMNEKKILTVKFCRCLGLIVDVNLVKTPPSHTFGRRKTWMTISAEPYLRWRVIETLYNWVYICTCKSEALWIIRILIG